MPATLYFPATDAYGKPADAVNAALLAELQDAYTSVIRTPVTGDWTDLETGRTYPAPMYAYTVAPTHTARLAGRLEKVAARWVGATGFATVDMMDDHGRSYEVRGPLAPTSFMSRKVRDALDQAA